MKIWSTFASILFVGVIFTSEAQATLITNGSFESGLDGWTASRYFDVRGIYGFTDGVNSLEFAYGDANSSNIFQNLNTEVGVTYQFSFDWKMTHPGFQSMNVLVDGANILSVNGGYGGQYNREIPFTHFEGSFVATSLVTSFGFFDTSLSSFQQDQVIDNVIVTTEVPSVPEPLTFVIFGFGSACLLFGLRKREQFLL
jgi:hypothetical protein